MLTLLKTSDVNGLQVKVDDDWVAVDPPEKSFIINLGTQSLTSILSTLLHPLQHTDQGSSQDLAFSAEA